MLTCEHAHTDGIYRSTSRQLFARCCSHVYMEQCNVSFKGNKYVQWENDDTIGVVTGMPYFLDILIFFSYFLTQLRYSYLLCSGHQIFGVSLFLSCTLYVYLYVCVCVCVCVGLFRGGRGGVNIIRKGRYCVNLFNYGKGGR